MSFISAVPAPSQSNSGPSPAWHWSTAAINPSERIRMVDRARVFAAHVIVWHHLVAYGPLSDAAWPLMPRVMDFLFEYGRCAVQVFFVVGGFVAALTLEKRPPQTWYDGWEIVRRRYLRLGGPYLVLLIVAIGANWLADHWLDGEYIAKFPTVPQFLAHALFLHDLLKFETLTAGIWYLAIDLQLLILLVALSVASRQASRWINVSTDFVLQIAIWSLAAASLYWFNRKPEWDVWALYFFGSYALGFVTARALRHRTPDASFWAYLLMMSTALILEWRIRLIVGVSTAIALYGAGRMKWLLNRPQRPWLTLAADSSYSLFLVHFPVCLLVNAWLSNFVLDSPIWSLAGMLLAYALSVLASIGFYYSIERRFR